MQVREIMTKNPAFCTPDSSLHDVAKMMQVNDCGCIPVVDSQIGMKPVGTITDRDITIRTVAANQNPTNMKASDIMTTDIATVTPQMSVEQCFDVMEDKEIRRVLVVDEQGRCCGIVAQADVVQSNANPIRTNKVIREISESSPSRNQTRHQRIPRGNQRIPMDRQTEDRNYEFHSSEKTNLISNFTLPFILGVSSGIALMYLFNTKQKTSRRAYLGNLDTEAYRSDYLNATNQENFGKYVDAEQEVEKRQQDLEDRVQTLRTESNIPLNNKVVSLDREDETIISKDKGRSANQG